MECSFCQEELEVSLVMDSEPVVVCTCSCDATWTYGLYLLSCTAPTKKVEASLKEIFEKYLGPLPELP